MSPTYNCGVKCGYKYYHTGNEWKCWRSTAKMNTCFKNCCNAGASRKEAKYINCGFGSLC